MELRRKGAGIGLRRPTVVQSEIRIPEGELPEHIAEENSAEASSSVSSRSSSSANASSSVNGNLPSSEVASGDDDDTSQTPSAFSTLSFMQQGVFKQDI